MTDNPSVAIVLGTRPEIIKLAPVIRACDREEVPYTIIHTGQHYSDSLDTVFFEQLELPAPDFNLDVGSGTHGEQTGTMISGIEDVLLNIEPDTVLAQGDTNSVLSTAIAVSKLEMEFGHVEAGLRSFDREMPEEINRIVADHVGDFLFAPTDHSAELLENEGLPDERIYITGNTVVDAVYQHVELAQQKSSILDELTIKGDDFAVMTAHRAENVDNAERFAGILDGVAEVASIIDGKIIYPIHPRAENRIEEFDLEVPDAITLVDPLDYLDFLRLEDAASLILTDSGGVQEEACILRTPCVTMRDSTERPETISAGGNVLAGVGSAEITKAAIQMLDVSPDWENPFGDGNAAKRILSAINIDAAYEFHTEEGPTSREQRPEEN